MTVDFMGFSVNSNIPALKAANSVSRTSAVLEKTLVKISTGLRINNAAEDAAGLSVATTLETVARSNRQAMRNANDGTSILQTAESTAQTITDNVQRARELFVQAASETLDDDERAYLKDEYEHILAEIDRSAFHMEFNGVGLNGNDFIVQIGAQNDPDHQLTIAIDSMLVADIGMPDSTAMATSELARAQLQDVDGIDAALDSILAIRSNIGAAINRMEI